MTLTRDLIMLAALTLLGAVLLLIYAGLALAVFRCEKLDKRRRWYGLVIPGAAIESGRCGCRGEYLDRRRSVEGMRV